MSILYVSSSSSSHEGTLSLLKNMGVHLACSFMRLSSAAGRPSTDFTRASRSRWSMFPLIQFLLTQKGGGGSVTRALASDVHRRCGRSRSTGRSTADQIFRGIIDREEQFDIIQGIRCRPRYRHVYVRSVSGFDRSCPWVFLLLTRHGQITQRPLECHIG